MGFNAEIYVLYLYHSRFSETKNRLWNCTDNNGSKIKNWKDMSKNRADWEESINEAKVRIGQQCHLRREIRFSGKKDKLN